MLVQWLEVPHGVPLSHSLISEKKINTRSIFIVSKLKIIIMETLLIMQHKHTPYGSQAGLS